METLLENWQKWTEGESSWQGWSFYIKWKAKSQQNMVNIVTVTVIHELVKPGHL